MKMSGVQIIIKICNIQSCICHIGYLNKNSSVQRMVQGMAQIGSYFVEEKKTHMVSNAFNEKKTDADHA